MNAVIFDQAVDVEEKHFIHQEGDEPNKLNGPLFLPNLKQDDLHPFLMLTEDQEVAKSTFTVVDLIRSFQAQMDKLADQSIEKFLERKKAIFTQGKWSGDDIGSFEEPLNEIHSKGEFFGLRIQNVDSLPPASGKNIGRLVFQKEKEKVSIDCGWGFKNISSDRFQSDIQWSDQKEVSIDLSNSSIIDARSTIWQLSDPSDGFLRMNVSIKTPNEKTVVISGDLKTGTYRLVGIE